MIWWCFITYSNIQSIIFLVKKECTKCSNSKAYQCVQLKGKPGCRTCSSRRISCSRHVQYLVEMTASRLGWSVEKTKSMYDKYVKQTRSGKKSVFQPFQMNKKIPPPPPPTRKTMVCISVFLSAWLTPLFFCLLVGRMPLKLSRRVVRQIGPSWKAGKGGGT